jgi:hypothetical protein
MTTALDHAEGEAEMSHWSRETEVVAVSKTNVEHLGHPDEADAESPSLEELARRRGVKPVTSLEEMARPALFESDEELEEFLAFTAAKRRADLA